MATPTFSDVETLTGALEQHAYLAEGGRWPPI
jgi:hypothetical protein